MSDVHPPLLSRVTTSVFLWLMTGCLTVVTVSGRADDLAIGTRHHLSSSTLGETREYWVSLPASYQPDGYTRYPVLYLLDPDLNSIFHAYTGMVRQMAADASPQVPEMIVVGIVNRHRLRDSSPTRSLIQYGGARSEALNVTGGADDFLRFLRTELMPHIDRTYPTSGYRLLSGYSFTGLVVLQALYTMPDMFNAYLAIDPSLWWDDGIMLKRREALAETSSLHKRRLYVATSRRAPSIYPDRNYVLDFIERMRARPISGVDFGSTVYGVEENHHTMPVSGFYEGLRFLFDGYMVDHAVRFRPAAELRDHFERFSDRVGATFVPREDVVNFYAYDRLYNDQFGVDVERALEFFELNVAYYPRSSAAWGGLGEGHDVNGDVRRAADAYRRSLMIDPDNHRVRERLDRLEQDHGL